MPSSSPPLKWCNRALSSPVRPCRTYVQRNRLNFWALPAQAYGQVHTELQKVMSIGRYKFDWACRNVGQYVHSTLGRSYPTYSTLGPYCRAQSLGLVWFTALAACGSIPRSQLTTLSRGRLFCAGELNLALSCPLSLLSKLKPPIYHIRQTRLSHLPLLHHLHRFIRHLNLVAPATQNSLQRFPFWFRPILAPFKRNYYQTKKCWHLRQALARHRAHSCAWFCLLPQPDPTLASLPGNL